MGRTYGTGSGMEQSEHALDFRRRREGELSTMVVRRAHWLRGRDREIAISFFQRGMHATEIASMMRMNARHVRKRIKQIVLRLRDPRCAYVVAHASGWSPRRRQIGEDLYIHGHSMRRISEQRGLSLHAVRKHRDAIDAMAMAAQQGYARPSRAWMGSERGPS